MTTGTKKLALFGIIAVVGLLLAVYFVTDKESGVKSKKSQDTEATSVSVGSSVGEKNQTGQDKEKESDTSAESVSDRAVAENKRFAEAQNSASTPADRNGGLSPEERRVEDLDNLVNAESYNAAIKLARELMKSDNAQIRLAVAENLGWIGLEALPELSVMINDPEKDVAESAFNYWLQAVENLEDEQQRVGLLVEGLKTVEDEFRVEEGVMMLNSLPDEVSVRALVRIIEEGNPVASVVARDNYFFFTEQEYVSRQGAEKWLDQQAE